VLLGPRTRGVEFENKNFRVIEYNAYRPIPSIPKMVLDILKVFQVVTDFFIANFKPQSYDMIHEHFWCELLKKKKI
jgi:hypothetical protein